jgi:hypothetical protein
MYFYKNWAPVLYLFVHEGDQNKLNSWSKMLQIFLVLAFCTCCLGHADSKASVTLTSLIDIVDAQQPTDGFQPAAGMNVGSSGNLDKSGMFARQLRRECPAGTHECPGGVLCCLNGLDCISGGFCCPTGQQRCGQSHCYNPKTQICCTNSVSEWGCASDQSCCNKSRSCYYPESQICCEFGACPKADTCCKNQCCRPVATCGIDGICTRTASTSGCPTPTPKTPQIETETISFVYDASRSWVPKSGPNKGQTITGSNEGVIRNMCDGIKTKGAGGSSLTLTHGGKCFQKQNRKEACPKGWCADGVKSYIQSLYPPALNPTGPPESALQAIDAAKDMSCDEFPFASSVDGGNGAVRRCVTKQDNGWQGGTMSRFFNKKTKGGQRIKEGEKYVVQIVGWDCEAQAPIERTESLNGLQARDAFSGDGVNVTGHEMYHNFDPSDPDMKLMSMPLGDLSAGSYTVNLIIAGGILNLTLVDYNGETYDMTQAGSTVSFTLDDDTSEVCLIGTTYNGNVSAVYSAATANSTSSTTRKSGGQRTKFVSLGINLGISSAVVLFLLNFLVFF